MLLKIAIKIIAGPSKNLQIFSIKSYLFDLRSLVLPKRKIIITKEQLKTQKSNDNVLYYGCTAFEVKNYV